MISTQLAMFYLAALKFASSKHIRSNHLKKSNWKSKADRKYLGYMPITYISNRLKRERFLIKLQSFYKEKMYYGFNWKLKLVSSKADLEFK